MLFIIVIVLSTAPSQGTMRKREKKSQDMIKFSQRTNDFGAVCAHALNSKG